MCYVISILFFILIVFRHLWRSRAGPGGGLLREFGLRPRPETPHRTTMPPPQMSSVETWSMEYGKKIDYF